MRGVPGEWEEGEDMSIEIEGREAEELEEIAKEEGVAERDLAAVMVRAWLEDVRDDGDLMDTLALCAKKRGEDREEEGEEEFQI